MASSSSPTASTSSPSSSSAAATMESLLFKATNPTNKIEDVNTIKAFCDCVSAADGGAALACRLLAHKIQSPQEREAIQALAVLEASARSCGTEFHAEVGKFKFLNEMIKLVSPKYLGPRTPEHVKKKVLELLYMWTRELGESEPKIPEAYAMLKREGIVKEDPAYVGEAVFASSLPPRKTSAPLSEHQTKQLKKLLQSTNPDDLQEANKIIKGMVKEDEKRMDALTKRSTELVMVNNNAKLLSEMLDHYGGDNSGNERELLDELFSSCEKMQPKLFRMASETDDGDDCIADILAASDELSRVIDRYKFVVLRGRTDSAKKDVPAKTIPATNTISRPLQRKNSEELLDLGGGGDQEIQEEPLDEEKQLQLQQQLQQQQQQPNALGGLLEEDILGLNLVSNGGLPETMISAGVSNSIISTGAVPSIDDLLNNSSPIETSAPTLITSTLPSSLQTSSKADSRTMTFDNKMEEQKASRQRGLLELDSLGEAAIQSVLSGSSKSPQFPKKKEKMSLSDMQKQKISTDLRLVPGTVPDTVTGPNATLVPGTFSSSTVPSSSPQIPQVESAQKLEPQQQQPVKRAPGGAKAVVVNSVNYSEQNSVAEVKNPPDETATVKLSELEVPLSSIRPSPSIPPLTLPIESAAETGLSVALHFGADSPAPNVTAAVVTASNASTAAAIVDLDIRMAAKPKGCRVRLCGSLSPSATLAVRASPFVPPAAATQVMLIETPSGLAKGQASLQFVIAFTQDGEQQTEMGRVDSLPI